MVGDFCNTEFLLPRYLGCALHAKCFDEVVGREVGDCVGGPHKIDLPSGVEGGIIFYIVYSLTANSSDCSSFWFPF